MVAVVSLGIAANAAEVGKYSSGIGVADSIPMGTAGDNYKSSLGFVLFGDYQVNEQISAGLEAAFFTYAPKKDLIVSGFNFGKPLDAASGYYGIFGKYAQPMELIASKKGNIYGILGIASYSTVKLEADNFTGLAVNDKISKLGLNIGGGYDMELAPQWTAGLEVRYHMASGFNTIAPMVKIAYTF